MSEFDVQEHEELGLRHEHRKGHGEGNRFLSPSTQAKHPQAPRLPSLYTVLIPSWTQSPSHAGAARTGC